MNRNWSRYRSINRYWSRYWYRTCNLKSNGRNRKTAGSRRKNHKSIITWMCIGRRYCNFRYGSRNFNYLILRLKKGYGRVCSY